MAQLCSLAVVVLVITCMSTTSGTGFNCPKLFGFHGDSYDCTKFYQCVFGNPVAFSCPTGTRWNSLKTTCDHNRDVSCYGYGATHASPSYGTNTAHGTLGYNSYSTVQQGYGGAKSYASQTQGNAYGYSQPSSYGSNSYTSNSHGYSSGSYYSNGNSHGKK